MKLTKSELEVFNTWGKPLRRKITGCDFREVGGELIEVKTTSGLRRKQVSEIIGEYERGRRPFLIFVRGKRKLIFRLERIDGDGFGTRLREKEM